PWRLAAPGLDDELFELVDADRGQPYEDRGETVVVRLGEELLVVGSEERLLVEEIGDADRDHVGPWHPGLLWLDALVPGPAEPLLLALVEHGESEMTLRLARVGQGERDAANVVLVSHDRRTSRR